VKICFFCGESIVGPHEQHHITPRRYVKGKHQANLAPAHPSCHRRFHRNHDDPKWRLWEFRQAMTPINYGENIFA
jgi:5-methylcytosine-specific restriction endonuclease McrA